MGDTVNSKSCRFASLKILSAIAIGFIVGILVRDPIFNRIKTEQIRGEDYDIEELEVDYLRMIDGAKGVASEVINGVKCLCKCDEAHPEGDLIVYKFQGYIGDESTKRIQKFQFKYAAKPHIVNGELECSGGEILDVSLEPENEIVNGDGMKRIINAFVIPQLKPCGLYVPIGAFAVKEMYSNMVVLKISKEK